MVNCHLRLVVVVDHVYVRVSDVLETLDAISITLREEHPEPAAMMSSLALGLRAISQEQRRRPW